MEITTPDQVIRELNRLMDESSKGITALWQCEKAVAEAEFAYESAFHKAFLDAQGTVADRNAVAKLKCVDLKFAWDLTKVELSRVKAKIKQLADAGTLTAVIAKQVELTYRNS